MIKKIIYLFALLYANTIFAQISIKQSDTLTGGVTNKNGKVIQLVISFEKPIEPNKSFELMIDSRKVLAVTNNSNRGLERFVTRLRLNSGEQVTVKTNDAGATIIPEITVNYEPPIKDEYSPSPRVSVVNDEIAKSLGTKVGDCVYLFSRISNSGDRVPKSFNLKSNIGEAKVTSSERVSFSPFFLIGFSEVANQCSATVDEGSANLNTVEQTSISLEQAQTKCADFGFKFKTEEFGRCVLRLSK
jgi:hypothetical protein